MIFFTISSVSQNKNRSPDLVLRARGCVKLPPVNVFFLMKVLYAAAQTQ